MANINLNRFYGGQNNLKSTVDSKIKISTTTTKQDKWGDIRLDMEDGEYKHSSFNAH